MQTSNAPHDLQNSLVSFKNSQGVELQATLLKLDRFQVAFELYAPDSLLRISEVLCDFQIRRQETLIYSGQVLVKNLVTAGAVVVCEATLQDGWTASETERLAGEPQRAQADFKQFLQQWQRNYKISPEFKVILADLQSFLGDLRLWLEHVELGIRSLPSADRLEVERRIVGELAPSITSTLGVLFEKFEIGARSIDPELRPAHAAFCRRQLHPHLMASPFMHRIFVKPLGYAGDYEMVNMILRDPCEGGSLFAKLLNVFILSQNPAIAHRNRVAYLTRRLVEETSRLVARGRNIRILNLGCGPAKEVQNFMAEHELSDRAEFELLDFDEETLTFLRRALEEVRRRYQRRTTFKIVKKSVHQELKQTVRHQTQEQSYNLIYCAGLFDYLNNRTCKALLDLFYHRLAPGGLMLATNVEGQNPIRNIMEYIFEWPLIYRSSAEFAALVPEQAPRDCVSIQMEPSGGNIFIEVRKPEQAV